MATPPPDRSPRLAGSEARPRPLTKMRLKRLLSLGGSCTFGIAAGGETGCPGAPFRRGGHRGGPMLGVGQRAMGHFMAWSRGWAGRAGRWAGLAMERERDLEWTTSTPVYGLVSGGGSRARQDGSWGPSPRAGRRAPARGAQQARGGGGVRAAGTAVCGVLGCFCHRHLGRLTD